MSCPEADSPVRHEPINGARQAIAYLMSLVRDDPRPYQARAGGAGHPIRALLARLGDPHIGLPVVHLAGSKGKGSTALYLEAILNAAGLRTGTFTSPHLQRWTERYRVDGRESTPSAFAALFERLRPHVTHLQRENAALAPGFFDVLTAAAFSLFAEEGVDCAIIETGIGGRLDATNVVQPIVSCITSVELEHTDKLGDTIEAIAAEKAGIIKRGVPAVIGTLPAQAARVIRDRAARLDAPVSALGQDIELMVRPSSASERSIEVRVAGRIYRATLARGAAACNAHNAALAIACAHRVAGNDEARLQRAIGEALIDTRPPGRMEIAGERPWVIIDGAHTQDSIRALADMLSTFPADNLHLLVSLSSSRDAARLLSPLLERAHRVVTTRADPVRSLDSEQLAAGLVAQGFDTARVQAIADPYKAVLISRGRLAHDDMLCIAGSMYMAGVARDALLSDGPWQPGLR